MEAYNLPLAQIVGGPSWIHKTRFDIEAKPPADVASRYVHPRNPKNPPPDEIRRMLCNLLTHRFQLKLHFEQREGKVYVLARGRGSLHLNPSKDENAFPWAGGVDGGLPEDNGLRGENISMSNLASRLSQWLSKPVVDQTGLTGSYDFLVVLNPNEIKSELVLGDNLFESLKELGLQLKTSTGMIQTLVIDQASFPSDN